MSRKKFFKNVKRKDIIIGVIVTVAVFFGVSYLYMLGSYRINFTNGTTINGIDVSGLTVEEAETKMREGEDDYVLTLKFRNNNTETIYGKDFAFHCVNQYDIEKLLDKQNNRLWFIDILFRKSNDYMIEADFSEEQLKKQLNLMPALQKQNMEAPQDAFPVYKDGSFSIQPEVLGTTLQEKNVYKAVTSAVKKSESTLDMESVYDAPDVKADDKELTEQIPNLNDLVGTKVTYLLPNGKKKVLNGTTLVKWLKKDKNGKHYKDQDRWKAKIKEFVHTLAKEVDTTEQERTFVTHSGETITLPATSYYGWKISEEEEAKQLEKDLKTKKAEKRKPVYSMMEAADLSDNDGFGRDYCEVDLGAQHLWVYKKGKVVLETDVVSGKDDSKHRTPAGAFTAYDMQQNKILRGEKKPNGKYEYETPTKYWIRLTNQGVGLHDAPWRGSFGGSIWKKGGSHGCINLPAAAAAKIYELMSNGTPVIVYY